MKFPNLAYTRPASLVEALTALSPDIGAVAMAGGQSLLPMLAFRLGNPVGVADIARLPELAGVEETAHGLRIGALVTHAAVEDGKVPGPVGAFLARVAGGIAFRAVRNRGTLGGSLAHADPAADWPVVFAGLGAFVETAGPRWTRRLTIPELVAGELQTTLEPAELITAIVVPWAERNGCGVHKTVRKAGEFAEAFAVAVAGPDQPDIWVGVVAGRPLHVAAAVDPAELAPDRAVAVTGSHAALVGAIAAAVPEAAPYRVHLAATAACRAVRDAYYPQEC